MVPRTLKDTVLKSMHDNVCSAHLGVNKTFSRLHRNFFWYRMKEDVRDWIRSCSVCGARKSPTTKPRAKLGDCRVGHVLDRVDTDILGPFPETVRKNKYILVFQDKFSKWVEAYAIPDFTAETVAHKFVYEFCSRWGFPLELTRTKAGTMNQSYSARPAGFWEYTRQEPAQDTQVPMGV